MGTKTVTCHRCQKPIENQTDLRTANVKMTVRPYHESCFKKRVEEKKEKASMFFDATPFNGRYANMMTLIFIVLFVLFLTVIDVPSVAYAFVLIYPLYRLFSWVWFERRLN
ncbi:hypothetical protein ABID56_002058 [Alkalibacillus flavidus]|uniref:Uncharacterized protein n=1 Tax=Alkalibacillus flavidus TaxID=546021 RepID=A0ABV2KXU9_9BACI